MIELNENEQIKAIVYKHWIVLLWHVLKISAVVALPIFGSCYFGFCWQNLWGPSVFWTLIFIGAIWTVRRWIIWRKDIFIITNQRIVDINQKDLFDKEVAEMNYYKVRDVIYQVKGVLATTFDFGRVELHLAGGAILALERVPNPQKIQELIIKLKNETEMSAQELLDMATVAKKKDGSTPLAINGESEEQEEKTEFKSTLV